MASLKQKALAAKKEGNIDLAKRFLIEAKKLELSDDLPINQNSKIQQLPTKSEEISTTNQTDFNDVFLKSIDHYEKMLEKSKSENATSKTRRYQRTIDEFKMAHQKFKNKAPYSYGELVVAPGCPSIPPNPFSSPPSKTIQKDSIKIEEECDQISDLKKRAIEAKRAGNIALAKTLLLEIKNQQSPQKEEAAPMKRQKSSEIESTKQNTTFCNIKDIKNYLDTLMKDVNYGPLIVSPCADDLSSLKLLQDRLQRAIHNRLNQIETQYGASSETVSTTFQKRYVPKLIRNINLQPDTLSLTVCQITNLQEIVSCSSDTLIISVTYPFPKESPKTIESNPFKYLSGVISTNINFNFRLDRCNKATIRQIKRSKITISIATPGGLFRRSEVIATGNLLIDQLLKCATSEIFVQPKSHLFNQLQFLDVSKIRSLELLNYEYSELEKKINVLENSGDEYDVIVAKIILFGIHLKRNHIRNLFQLTGPLFIKEYLEDLANDLKLENQKIEFYSQHAQEVIDFVDRK
ncbi:hypothetical protein RF11_13306 [Thelohanellus kitauei]|uniref:Coiled-coil and C2 domain-containing protein 1-like protein n=1 Tax=Thelohanellus kitauei TaxID=669202 RepID=A0A0C2J988_THEKT|nr:hypothetical protein RF11_13306 [Thelohanellus kitauei]